MGVLDDIMGTSKVIEAPAIPNLTIPKTEYPIPAIQAPQTETPKVQSYSDLYKSLNPAPQLDEASMKKLKKRENARSVLGAVADGISALSNLYSTTKGAMNVNVTPQLSERNAARYERYRKRLEDLEDERRRGLTDAAYKDMTQAYRDKRDKVADDRYNQQYADTQEWRNKEWDYKVQARKEDVEYRDGQAESNQRNIDTARNDRNTQFWANFKSNKEHKDKMADTAQLRAQVYANRGTGTGNNKHLTFVDANTKQEVAIPENVWKASMQNVFEVLVSDEKFMDSLPYSLYLDEMKASDKENFVKSNWFKTTAGRNAMNTLSKIDLSNLQEQDDDLDFDVDQLFD